MSDKRIILAGPANGGLRSAAGVLERAGFDIVSVDSPEVLETFGAGKEAPDLVIVDESFGPEGGVAVCRDLRRNSYWRLVSLMLVVPAGEQHLEECLISGINDFILAPFPADELLDKVRRLTVIPARRELNTLVRVHEGDPAERILLGKTLNLSLNGLLIEIETLLPIGRKVAFEFFLPEDPASIRGQGRVIRRALELDLFHPAFGLRFDEMSDADHARINAFVATREHPGDQAVLADEPS
ncbi:MAG: PilZ domain-containing protein [Thermoanaerobaculia bacterium]